MYALVFIMNFFTPINFVNIQAKPEVSEQKKETPTDRKKTVLSSNKTKAFDPNKDSNQKDASSDDKESEQVENVAINSEEFQIQSNDKKVSWYIFHENEPYHEFFHQEKIKSEENLLQNLFNSLCSNAFESFPKTQKTEIETDIQTEIENPQWILFHQCIAEILQTIDFNIVHQSPIPSYHQPYEEIPQKLYRNWMGLPLLVIDLKNIILDSPAYIMLIDFERSEYYLVSHSEEDKRKRQYFGAFPFTINESFSEITAWPISELLSAAESL